ncbi:MAG: transposase [Candidatus Marsarchaeota archaeon]|nr:transposase [Candidatus Marsarchaeota archaeon]
MIVTEASARNITMMCSGCGTRRGTSPMEEECACGNRGMRVDRGMNASINILKGAAAGHAGSYEGGNARPQCGAVIKEPKTCSAPKGWNP